MDYSKQRKRRSTSKSQASGTTRGKRRIVSSSAEPFRKGSETQFFLDRDLSLLQFNLRVLEQARDESQPLLERARFLSIFHSNLDEFFMKRIGAPRNTTLFAAQDHKQDRMTVIRKKVEHLYESAFECYDRSIRPQLLVHGIEMMKWKDLTKVEKEVLNQFFDEKVFPILTPLAVDPAHPFPHISNLSTSFAVATQLPDSEDLTFSRVKIPAVFPPWLAVNPEKKKKEKDLRFISLREIIENNLSKLFPQMKIAATLAFRVTRNIELERDEQSFDDFVEMVEEELKQRRFGEVVKLEVLKPVDGWLLERLMEELELSQTDVYELDEEIDYSSLNGIASLNIPELRYPIWLPVSSRAINEESSNIFNAISQKDILVHHPFESFTDSVEKFIYSAASDPNVRAIKMTLYRIHEDSTIMASLVEAAEKGKEVVCLIELKARFDEERNINWANKLENAGVHVVYGMQGLKTHSKLALVVRQEADTVKSYLHVGTGNYHSQNAKFYTDLGLFTCHPEITSEVVHLFNFLTGHSLMKDYRHLLVAPINMKDRFLELIDREIKNHRAGKPSGIIIKCNNLEDQDMCNKLYEASQAGVQVELIIRTICVLRPGVKGLSENIRVYSVVGRYLEHSRVFYFRDGQEAPDQGLVFMGSADWMSRNLMRRVEVVCPVLSSSLKSELYSVLQIMLQEDWQTWRLQSDGGYTRLSSPMASPPSSQELLMEMALKNSRKLL